MEVSALQCGVHPPYDERAAEELRRAGIEPTAVHNNCSGKHAGILALCKILGADTATYLSAENPAQRYILEFCARLSDDDASSWPIGGDGCGIPGLCHEPAQSGALIRAARYARGRERIRRPSARSRTRCDGCPSGVCIRHGPDRYRNHSRGRKARSSPRPAPKASTALRRGRRVSVTFLRCSTEAPADGARLPLPPLRALGALSEEQAAKLARFAHPTVYNRAGRAVGEIFV